MVFSRPLMRQQGAWITQYPLRTLSTQSTITFPGSHAPSPLEMRRYSTTSLVLTRCGLYSSWCLRDDLRVSTLRLGPWGQGKRSTRLIKALYNLLPFKSRHPFDFHPPIYVMVASTIADLHPTRMFIVYSPALVRRLTYQRYTTLHFYQPCTRDGAIGGLTKRDP